MSANGQRMISGTMLKQTKEFNSSRNDEMAIIIIFRNIVQPK
jgi:hypothetical protein